MMSIKNLFFCIVTLFCLTSSLDSLSFRRRHKPHTKLNAVATSDNTKEAGKNVTPGTSQQNIIVAQNEPPIVPAIPALSEKPAIGVPAEVTPSPIDAAISKALASPIPEVIQQPQAPIVAPLSQEPAQIDIPLTGEQDALIQESPEPVQPLSIEPMTEELGTAEISEEPKGQLNNLKPFQKQTGKEKKSKDADEEDSIEFYFENTDLQNVVAQIAQLYNVTFIPDDIISPLANGNLGRKALKGNKLSFKTNKPLSKKDGWNLFIKFLDIAGFAVVPDADPKVFRITTIQNAQRAAIPSFIGVAPETLPDSDQLIRYVYFIENINPEMLGSIVTPMLSTSAGTPLVLRELKALILTDKSYNIKTLMKIVKELDQGSMPQAMSVLKLTRADAKDVAKLYTDITRADDANIMSRMFPARKQPTSLYFPENVRVIPVERSNSLVLLGSRDAIEKIENFVTKFIDVDPDKPYSPLHTYQLQYTEAANIAKIMNDLTKFGADTTAGKVGGVRGGDKYFKPMLFIPEPSTNRLVIRGEYEDYLKVVEILKKLDEPQAQVALEILICTVELTKKKELGGQLRSKNNGISCGPLGSNVTFQTGNMGEGFAVTTDGSPAVKSDSSSTFPGCERLLGNLLDIAKNLASGQTVVSLGCDAFGVWGIFRALETITDSEVIANPFVVTTNKTEAIVKVGEIRRLIQSTIAGDTSIETRGDETGALQVKINPQINSDGMIVLDIIVDITQFTEGTTADQAQRTIRRIATKTTVADNEVIALGGIIQNRVDDSTAKTPLLGDIPLIGWLFKDRLKAENKGNLLMLVSTKIVKAGSEEGLAQFTNKHIDDYYGALGEMSDIGQHKDPITRLFFQESKKDVERRVEDLLFKGRRPKEKRRGRRRKKQVAKEVQQPMVAQAQPTIIRPENTQIEQSKQPIDHSQILAKSKDRQQSSLADLGSETGEKVL